MYVVDKTIKNKNKQKILKVLMSVKIVVELGSSFQCSAPVTKK